MSLVKRLAVLALALALVLGLYGLARAQNVKPLSEADLTKLIELQVGDDAVTAWMERSGVAFPIDAAVRARAREQAEREAEAKRLALLEEQERCKAEEEERARRREAEEQADLPPRVKALIEALQDKDPEVREAAALSLAKMGAKAQGVVSALEQALLGATKAKDPEVRRWATKWLGKLDEGKPPRVKALSGLIEALQDDDASVRGTAALSLAKMGAKAQGAAPALVKRVADERSGSWFCNEFTSLPPSFGVSPWVATNDKDNALVALKTIAPEMVEQALIDATKAKNPEVKRWAAYRLGELDGGK